MPFFLQISLNGNSYARLHICMLVLRKLGPKTNVSFPLTYFLVLSSYIVSALAVLIEGPESARFLR